MTFYLKPPKGVILYHVLQKCTEERMKFFKNNFNGNTNICIEYLFEDSGFDRAGHFILRLAAIRDPSFLPFFLDCELRLLELRLNSYNDDLMHKFLRKSLRHLDECIVEYARNEEVVSILKVLLRVIKQMLDRSYRKHVFRKPHLPDYSCKPFTIKVPFKFCTTLVSERKVGLGNGYVHIKCENWQDLLLSLFHTFLRTSINEMKHNRSMLNAVSDHRIEGILNIILYKNSPQSYSTIHNFDEELKLFPLCMLNLHSVLHKKHRLSHEERFNYSLFLKDIGMSLDDSLVFWKNEYLKESHLSNCSHSWERDEKKYVYSIRHLYGLEGSRKNYSSRTCSYFQHLILSPIQEGGCPFQHFDNDNLKKLIGTCFTIDIEDLDKVLVEKNQDPSNACKFFMETTAKYLNNSNNSKEMNYDISFNSPVQYFQLQKKLQ